MNERDAGEPAISDQWLDLLIDGELSQQEYRALVGRISQEPDGWRRCALAFLEAQALRRDVDDLAAERRGERPLWRSVPATDPGSTDPRNAAEGVPYTGKWFLPRIVHARLSLLGMAASFLLAFGIGWLLRPLGVPPVVPALDVAGDRGAGHLPIVAVRDEGQTPAAEAVSPAPWQMVTLSLPEAGKPGGRSIRLPAIERQTVDEAWFDALPKAVPPDLLRALRQSGHEVRQTRELLPVPMNDGRQLIVPVDQVEVRYVGAKAYQ